MSSNKVPIGLRWRASTSFILTTVAVGLFTDLFLYGLIVPVLPFMLKERVNLPDEKIQSYVSGLLAAYAGASVIFSIPIGVIADRANARQLPFLCGLAALLGATIMLALGQSILVLVMARILQGISGAIVWTVGLAMVLDTVGPENLGKVIGSIFSFISVGELAAPVLGGVLHNKTGYAGVFGLGSALLVVDFILRMLMIERKTAAKYDKSYQGAGNPREHGVREEEGENRESSEEEPLLPKNEEEHYRIPHGQNSLLRNLPILYCFSSPRLLVALLLAFVQAALLATFDATIPTEAGSLFDFDSLQAGLLFIALDIPYLLLGPLAGWAVDKYGTKPAAVIGFGYLVPALILLRLPTEHLVSSAKGNIILYSALLSLNGIGLAVIGSPSIVEASDVVQKYDKANPGLFGENGPYAQLYAFNSLVFSAGLTIGPLISGGLRDAIGYGNMNLVVAGITGITAVLSFLYIGGKPKLLQG
ncbi:major facilitator superfamily domain-containing protein [Exophiala viscosa]|uniref:major facilitator superfamily domain-containing protein n=1 Tax=Exophiala viscosa TaxID=2486360 RepID=UPI0021915ED9|nr:major facilitator superfamily domain-containing protein [Exophiala viscosa]